MLVSKRESAGDEASEWRKVHDKRKLVRARRLFLGVWLSSTACLLALLAIGIRESTSAPITVLGGAATLVLLYLLLNGVSSRRLNEAMAVEFSVGGIRTSHDGSMRTIAWVDVSRVAHRGHIAMVQGNGTAIPVFAEFIDDDNGAAEHVLHRLRERVVPLDR